MKLTERERDILSLQDFGLLPEEIEAYFEFFNDVEVVEKPIRRVRILNSGRKIKLGEKR